MLHCDAAETKSDSTRTRIYNVQCSDLDRAQCGSSLVDQLKTLPAFFHCIHYTVNALISHQRCVYQS